jgi:Ras-related protein Rab-21
MEKKRQVEEAEAEQYAQSVGAVHVPTSAKTGKNVEVAFLELTKGMLKQSKAAETPTSAASSSSSSAAPAASSQRGFVDISKETEQANKGGCCS